MHSTDFNEQYEQDVHLLVKQFESAGNCFLEEDAFEQLLDYYEERFDYGHAMEVVDLAIGQYPYSSLFFVRKAQILYDTKYFNEAMELLDTAEVLDSTDVEIYLLRSDIHIWGGNYNEAIKVLNGALEVAEADDLHDIYLELADIYEDLEQYEKVIPYMKEVLKDDPKHEEALNRMWYCTEMLENFTESLQYHKELIDREPYSYLAWYNLGHAYAGVKEYENAVEAFEFAMAINENYDHAYRDCADVLFEMGQYERAAELYHRASIIAKPFKQLYYSLGECYEKMHNHNRARYYYRKATNLDPYYKEAFYKIGENYKLELNWSNAISSYERAYKLDEGSLDFQVALAEAYYQTGDFNRASTIYKKTVKSFPQEKNNWLRLAVSCFEAGAETEAIDTLNEASNLFDNDAELSYYKVAMLYETGQKREATLNLEKALATNYKQHPLIFALAPDMLNDIAIRDVIDLYLN